MEYGGERQRSVRCLARNLLNLVLVVVIALMWLLLLACGCVSVGLVEVTCRSAKV